MEIGIFNETEEEIKELETIEELMKYALKEENIEKAEFNIIIIDNERIRKINKEYRNIDRMLKILYMMILDY